MTQSLSTLTPQNRVGPVSSDAPDVMFVLKHYKWIIIIGAFVGLMLGGVAYYVCSRYYVLYEAFAQFQVKPSVNTSILTNENANRPEPTKEEIERTIRRQIQLIRTGPVLDTVIRDSDAFRKFRELHPNLPKIALNKILDVSPVPNTDLFRVAIRGESPQEVKDQVDSITTAYMQQLQQIERAEQMNQISTVDEAQKSLEKQVQDLREGLEEFKTSHDITSIMQTAQSKQTLLTTLSAEYIKAQTDSTGAKTNLDSIKKQVETGTLQLPGEYEQMLENDPSLRALENSKLQLDQEMAVNLLRYYKHHPSSISIQTRIDETQRQIDEMRSSLSNRYRMLVQSNAQLMLTIAQAKEQDLLAKRNSLEAELKDLDKWQVDYRRRSEQLDSKEKLLADITRDSLVKQLSRRSDVQRVNLFTPVIVPDSKDIVFPKWYMFIPTGAFIGLFLALGYGYIRELLNTKLRSPRDVSRVIHTPLLGFVPEREDDAFLDGDIATSIRTSPGSLVAVSYRVIRSRLAAQANGQPIKTLLVASATPGGGATTVASNLANGIALNGQKVLLIDANFYRPGIGKIYTNVHRNGFSDVVAGKVKISDVVVSEPELPNLSIMSAGSLLANNASELLESKGFRSILDELKSQYDLVIFDGAPLNLVSDSMQLGSKVDGVVMVVRAETTARGTVARVRDQLQQVHAHMMGIVLNAARVRGAGYFKQNYRSFYEYASHPAPKLPASSQEIASK